VDDLQDKILEVQKKLVEQKNILADIELLKPAEEPGF